MGVVLKCIFLESVCFRENRNLLFLMLKRKKLMTLTIINNNNKAEYSHGQARHDIGAINEAVARRYLPSPSSSL